MAKKKSVKSKAKKKVSKKAASKPASKKKVAKKASSKKKTAKKSAPKKVAKKIAKKVAKKKVAKNAAKKVAKKVVTKKVTKKVLKTTDKKVMAKKTTKDENDVIVSSAKATLPVEKVKKKKTKKTSDTEHEQLSTEEKVLTPSRKETDVAAEVETKIMGELATIAADFDWDEIRATISEMGFFKAPKGDECVEKNCENLAAVGAFCRLHYIKNWKGLKKKDTVLQDGKLQQYIEEIVRKYPLKYIEEVLNDLRDDGEFYKILKELKIDTSFSEDDSDGLDDDDSEDIAVETRGIDSRGGLEDEDHI